MEYRRLGKWGVRVSEIGLGTWMTCGDFLSDAECLHLVHYALDKGINVIDTANVYAHGAAETSLGVILKDIERSSVVLCTKVYWPMGKGVNDVGLSRKHVTEQCHASLKRLQTDYIDLYQCHRYDPAVSMEELVTTMDILTRQGKILYWGVSEWSALQILDAVTTARRLNAAPPVSNQPNYSILVRTIEQEIMNLCLREGLGIIAYSPLAQGVLTGKYKPGQTPETGTRASSAEGIGSMGKLMDDNVLYAVQNLIPIAQELGISMAQLSLAWCLRYPQMSSVLIGATKTSQIDDNIAASGMKLSEETIRKIDEAYVKNTATDWRSISQ